MKRSLYNYFGCESKEELYEMVRENHAEVRSLRDFIEYSKGDRENTNHHIGSPEDFVRYVKDNHLPNEDECKIVFTNTKNVPVHTGTFFVSDKKSFHSVIKEGLQAGGVGCLVLNNEADMAYEGEIKNFLELINVEPLDTFRYNHENQTVHSTKGYETFRLDSMRFHSEVKDSYETLNKNFDEDLVSLDGFEEFSSFYARKEVVGLNVFDEVDDVQDALKVGYQFDQQEVFGLLTCDSEGFVLSLSEMFKGSANASIVDPRVYTQKILEDDEIAYVAVFHNHPSGQPEPSEEDKRVTKRLSDISRDLEIDLLDHFIIGKDSVYSFAFENEDAIHSNLNEEYFQSISIKSKQVKSYGKQLSFNSHIKEMER